MYDLPNNVCVVPVIPVTVYVHIFCVFVCRKLSPG